MPGEDARPVEGGRSPMATKRCEHVFYMGQPEFRIPRVCCRCGRGFSGEEVRRMIGWLPVRSGWRCPDCSRAHAARIDAIAEVLVRGHRRHGWAGTAEHTPYDEGGWVGGLLGGPDPLPRR